MEIKQDPEKKSTEHATTQRAALIATWLTAASVVLAVGTAITALSLLVSPFTGWSWIGSFIHGGTATLLLVITGFLWLTGSIVFTSVRTIIKGDGIRFPQALIELGILCAILAGLATAFRLALLLLVSSW